MEGLTSGDLLLGGLVIFGFIVQYIALVVKFMERIVILETKVEGHEKDINNLVGLLRELLGNATIDLRASKLKN